MRQDFLAKEVTFLIVPYHVRKVAVRWNEDAVSHASCLGQLVPKLVPKPETKVEVHADASGCALSAQGGLESLQYNPTIARDHFARKQTPAQLQSRPTVSALLLG